MGRRSDGVMTAHHPGSWPCSTWARPRSGWSSPRSAADRRIRIIEEASRGVLLGRDTFSGAGVIQPRTADAAFAALDGFRQIMDGYGVTEVRAVATSAVREARNGALFLDRIESRSGITFEIINEAEETRLLYLAVRDSLKRHPAIKGAWTLLVEVGGGSTSLTLLRYGQPMRSGVYALGAVRFRQRLDLRRYGHDLQVALLKRVIANVIDEIRVEIPLHKVTQVVALGGDIRLAATHIHAQEGAENAREIPRDALRGVLGRYRKARRREPRQPLPSAGRRGRHAAAVDAHLLDAARRNRRPPGDRLRRVDAVGRR